MRKISALFVLFLFALVFSVAVSAQDKYPSKPIKIIIPLGPGSGNDVVTRILSESLEKDLKTQIIVEYKAGGGGGVVGADFVAKSKPDGYTLGTLNNSVLTNAPAFTPVPYDPVKDFTPIARLGSGNVLLVVNEPSPWKTLEGFLDYARKNPGKATCGTTGTASVGNLDLELLKAAARCPDHSRSLQGRVRAQYRRFAGRPHRQRHAALARAGESRAGREVAPPGLGLSTQRISAGSDLRPKGFSVGEHGDLVWLLRSGESAEGCPGQAGSSV